MLTVGDQLPAFKLKAVVSTDPATAFRDITLVPQLALDAGILRGTDVVTRPLLAQHAWREIGLAWRRGTNRRAEFLLLGATLRTLMERVHERATARSR